MILIYLGSDVNHIRRKCDVFKRKEDILTDIHMYMCILKICMDFVKVKLALLSKEVMISPCIRYSYVVIVKRQLSIVGALTLGKVAFVLFFLFPSLLCSQA